MTETHKPYEILDHTADLGIRVRGESLKALFENAALALFDSLAELRDVREDLLEIVQVRGMDLPELMVNWLNQLLFLWETKLLLFRRFSMEKMNNTALSARAWGEGYQADRHELFTDIKAATYHNLQIKERNGLWTAEIVLDT